ncbi:MAG: DDE-type integrase/transposase/recombinase [Candidatus Thiodiazotropha sp. (ex Lucinoma kastoroae)]|nr:DDE-type integrase/transposase/recombinase [Candidatus Thiodiazotropha sp. (ex Lucinoma kastoroae)]
MTREDVKPNPPLEMKLRVLSAVDYAPGDNTRERIKSVCQRTFRDETSGHDYQFTWRTIETWLYRFKKHGITSMDKRTRSDKNTYRKVPLNELAEAINDILPKLRFNKTGVIPKMALYRKLLEQNYFSRSQLSQTSFYRMIRDNDLLNIEQTKKLRLSFSMQFANELWQADTLYGPSIKQADGQWKKTFLIAFIDDASRVITHAEFFYADNTENMINAFKSALFKRGKPQRLYFDNGSNYKSKEILQACIRLEIHLSHAPVRDGAAKGKIERFFRGFRDRFLTQHLNFESLDSLNDKTHHWIENHYNTQYHSGIQMNPLDRFNPDRERLEFLTDDEVTEEIFFVEASRKVGKTNVFSINNQKYECPADLREKRIQVRYDRTKRDKLIVYFNEQRMGEATLLDLHFNAQRHMKLRGEKV